MSRRRTPPLAAFSVCAFESSGSPAGASRASVGSPRGGAKRESQMRSNGKAALLFLLLVPAAAQAARCTDCESPAEYRSSQQSPALVTHRVDPGARMIETSFTNGLSVVVDARLGQVLFAQDGIRTSMRIDDAFLRVANGDIKLANAYMAEALAILEDPTNVLQFSRVMPAISGSMTAQIAYDGTSAFKCQLRGYCYYVPRFIDIGGPANRNTYGFGYMDMHRLSPPQHSADYTMWAKFRQAACDNAKDHGAAATISMGGMAETCKRAASGARLALCGLGGMVVVYYSNKMAAAAKTCAASYPGPGKW